MTGPSARLLLCLAPLAALLVGGCGTRTAFRTAMAPIRSMGEAVGVTPDREREARLEPRWYPEDCDAYARCDRQGHVHFDPVTGR